MEYVVVTNTYTMRLYIFNIISKFSVLLPYIKLTKI